LELAVLGLLKEQPLHGYELKKRLGETLGFLWGVSYGSLYPALRRLEREGAIESVEPAPVLNSAPVPTGSITGDLAGARRRAGTRRAEGSRRTRKAYRVTEKGEALLVELLLADDDRADDDKGFALKLAFCRHAPADARLRFLERRREALRSRVDTTSGSGLRRERTERPVRSQDRYLTSLLEHRARATARDLEWVEELIASERGSDPEFLGQEGATA
jgi:DNA-binding PadR family transcriptional regulator